MRSRLQRIQQRKTRQLILIVFVATTLIPAIFSILNKNKIPSSGEAKGSYSIGVSPTPSLPQRVEEKETAPIIVHAVKAVGNTEVDEIKKLDTYVGDAVDEFFTTQSQRSEVRMILHCLLNRESKHNGDTGKGDGGLALGILQFHQETWNGYRKIMIKEGFATEIDSPYNDKEAIRTTVWAISDERATAWGPISRWNQGRYKEATCPMPSFYKK